MTDDDDIVEHLSPKGAMHALTKVAVGAGRLQDDLELVRLAFVGAISEAVECHMDLDVLPQHFKPMLDRLATMYTDAHDVARLVRDAGVAFYSLVEDGQGDAA